MSRAKDGACTIEAVAAKVAVPQAQALQTPAAFSPTPESTEFDPFCSLRPQLICPGLHTQPSLGAWTLGFSSRTMKEDIFPIPLFPIHCFVQLCSMPVLWFFVRFKIKRSLLAQEKENDYEPRVKFPVPLLFTKLCLTFLIRLRTISSTDRVVT